MAAACTASTQAALKAGQASVAPRRATRPQRVAMVVRAQDSPALAPAAAAAARRGVLLGLAGARIAEPLCVAPLHEMRALWSPFVLHLYMECGTAWRSTSSEPPVHNATVVAGAAVAAPLLGAAPAEAGMTTKMLPVSSLTIGQRTGIYQELQVCWPGGPQPRRHVPGLWWRLRAPRPRRRAALPLAAPRRTAPLRSSKRC